jgi:hypothetical protein
LPGYSLDIVAGHFDPSVSLLADVVLRHVVPVDGVDDAVDRRSFFARAGLAKAERRESGEGAVVPGPDIAERGGNPGWNSRNLFADR